jgi:hypothetical protein
MILCTTGGAMSNPHPTDAHESDDPVEALAYQVPVVLPVVGAALIFLLAAIAVGLA